MSSSTSRPALKIAVLSLSLIASMLGAGAAHASGARLLARDVSWTYDMQDGSNVRIEVVGGRVLVESSAPEYWTVVNSNLLVSPDGLRKIKLIRGLNGTVDNIEMEITSAR
jgi:hypothetical protein